MVETSHHRGSGPTSAQRERAATRRLPRVLPAGTLHRWDDAARTDRSLQRCSPTSSDQRRSRRNSATPGGACSSRTTTRSCDATSSGSAAENETPPETGSSRRSRARPTRSTAPSRRNARSENSASRSGQACISVRSRRSTASPAASSSWVLPASWANQVPARCSSRRRYLMCSLERGSHSTMPASDASRASTARCACTGGGGRRRTGRASRPRPRSRASAPRGDHRARGPAWAAIVEGGGCGRGRRAPRRRVVRRDTRPMDR